MRVDYLRTMVIYVVITLGAFLSGSMKVGAEVKEMVEDLIMHVLRPVLLLKMQ